jgi:SPP1 gp7 family putative phage head morphogenesis protein
VSVALETKQVHHTDLDSFARLLEPAARRAFLQAVEELRRSGSLRALEAAVASGSIFAVQEALRIRDIAEHFSGLRDVILDAVRGGGEIAVAEVGIGIRFDITDERALRYVQQHSGALIREVSDATRQGIVELIDYEFRQGRAPLPTARRIRERIGLTAYQERIAQNYEDTLRAAIRGEATWADVNAYRLNPIRGPGGLIESRVDAAVARYRQRLIAFRAETIARTETMTAVHAGQREGWRQLEEKGALPLTVRREWMTAEDERVCPICGPLDGQTTTLNASYPGGFDTPPAHPNCRCTEALVGL